MLVSGKYAYKRFVRVHCSKQQNKIERNSCQESWLDAANAHYTSWMTWVSKKDTPQAKVHL